MYTLNEIPLSGKSEQKAMHWMNVDFVFRYRAVGAHLNASVCKATSGPLVHAGKKKKKIQMLSNYTYSKCLPHCKSWTVREQRKCRWAK